MDGNAWRSAQGDPNTDNNDWRSQLTPDSRQRIVNKIMETLKKHLSVPEGMGELKKIAVRFEEKIYTAATSQPDYLRRISLKMLTMETKSPPNSLPSNLGSGNQNPPDPVLQNIQPQVRSQGQTLPIPMPNQSQARQQLLPPSLQNTVSSAGMQNSSNLSPALSSMTGITQTTMSNVIGQSSGLQNISGISQNSINNSGGQAAPSNIFANSQRSMQARQQVAPQHQLQQQQNQFIYQQQLQQQLLKQKLQHTSLLPQSHLQPQQTLLQATQMQQPSQQSLMQMSQNSGLQSSQTSLQQAQSSVMLPVQQSGLQQNQHSILRQQQQTHQQQTQIAQQQILPSQQQQQQLMGQQTNATNMQQNDQSGQQNSIQDIQQQQQQQQQQRLLGQPNNISNMQQNNASNLHQQQQQLGQQSNISGQQSISGQQLFGQQVGVSNAQRPIQQLLQAKAVVASQQQQSQQASSMLLPPQGQQSQSQTSQQQQLMSQLQSQPVQLQQQLPLQQQQQPNQLPRDLQQRFQTSGGLLQSQNVIEQQKQMLQPQRGIPEASSTSMDSTSQTGYSTPVDWQEETHQKLKSLKDMYLVEINELYQKLASKCQQQDTLSQSQIQSDQMEKLKYYKNYLERIIQYLQAPKSNISLNTKDKIGVIEKQIVAILNMFKRKPNSSQQHQQQGHQQFPPTGGQAHTMQQQQQQIQISHMQQQHDNHTNQMQPVNFQGSITSAMTTMQHGSMPSSAHLGVQTTQGMMNTLQQPGSNLEPKQGSSLSSLQQGQLGSLQQNTLNAPQQTNMNTLSQNNMNPLQSNINPLQQQHMKQQQEQQQLMQTQQMKQQLHPRQIHQLIQQQQHKQQILQQQQQQQQPHLQQQFQQQQLQTHQMQQLHQINEANEMKVKPGMGVKPGLFQQHHLISQRPSYQQLKPGTTFPVSSPQLIQATSPQISQSSPQIDQQSHLVSNLPPKAGTPLQPANSNSPFIVPSPSTPLAPSPIPGDSEKQTSGLYSLPTAGIIGHQQASLALAQTQSLAIGTPGISPSPLFEQCTGQDGNQGNASIVFSANKSNATERPLERLIKVVTSMSSKALSSSVSDIGSVVSMTDRIAGSAHVNGSRAAVGEDLVAMTKCRLQARNLMSQDASSATRKMRRQTSAMPLNTVSSAGSVNSGLRQLSSLEISEIESTATSRIKRQKVEAHHMLLEEIKEINLGLIDTVVDISDEDDSTTAAAKGREGTVIKCSFNAVALSPTMKSQYALAQMAPILPLLLLVPANYPICSPILLDEPPADPSKEFEDLSSKAKSSFSLSVRGLSQPISLGDMARTWDMCARKVITEYARQSGGGNFSSRFGSWESCVSA